MCLYCINTILTPYTIPTLYPPTTETNQACPQVYGQPVYGIVAVQKRVTQREEQI